jgi:ATP-dependent protease ClpP protease subunit
MTRNKEPLPAREIAVIGEVDDWEEDVIKAILKVPAGGACTFYIDSGGGSVFGALAVLTLIRQRRLQATAIVLGECSSAAVLLFAACQRRYVTPHSVLLFHRMRGQSEKRLLPDDAVAWARHFEDMERSIEELQVRLFGKAEESVRRWTLTGQYVTGPELVAEGLAELLDI